MSLRTFLLSATAVESEEVMQRLLRLLLDSSVVEQNSEGRAESISTVRLRTAEEMDHRFGDV